MVPLESLLLDPRWYLRTLDREASTATFVEVTPEVRATWMFHDWRAELGQSWDREVEVRVEELNAVAERMEWPRPPCMRFVFHTAFCCSTLLSKCLDALGCCYSLREPTLLTAYARELIQGRDAVPLGRLLTVLFGGVHEERAPVVKANLPANRVLLPILRLAEDSRGLFLFNPARTSMLSYLKRVDWVRDRARGLWESARSHEALPPVFWETPVDQLTPAKAAGYVWLAQVHFYLQLAEDPRGAAVRSLESWDLLERPQQVIEAVCSHLGLAVGPDEVAAALDLMDRRAKTPEVAYSAERRRTELEREYEQRRDEVDAALAWVESLNPVAGQLPRPLIT